MDASAYLKSHGWRGLGYSLDHKDRGLKRPLLVSQKQDVLGVGKQRHNNAHADQWWMRAFDESLKQIGTGQKVRELLFWPTCIDLSSFEARESGGDGRHGGEVGYEGRLTLGWADYAGFYP